jgi:hypothetical protein
MRILLHATQQQNYLFGRKAPSPIIVCNYYAVIDVPCMYMYVLHMHRYV